MRGDSNAWNVSYQTKPIFEIGTFDHSVTHLKNVWYVPQNLKKKFVMYIQNINIFTNKYLVFLFYRCKKVSIYMTIRYESDGKL